MTTTPTIGRIVHYQLSEADVRVVLADRQDIPGLQGNDVHEGDVYPAMIVRAWGDTPQAAVQLQVFIDGNHTVWATSRVAGDQPGQWAWPARL